MKLGDLQEYNTDTKSLQDVMKQRQKQFAQGTLFEAGDDAPHDRAKWVEATRQMLGTDQHGCPYTFGRINGLTRKWPVTLIRDRYYYCKKQNRPAFVWWGIRKQEKNENPT